MDSLIRMKEDNTVCNPSQNTLWRQEVMFEKLWKTATHFKKRFKHMSSFKQNQVICLVQLITSSLRSAKGSVKTKKTSKYTSQITNNKTAEQRSATENIRNLKQNKVRICKASSLDINETSSVNYGEENDFSINNLVDNIEIKFEQIDCKPEVIDINDVYTTVEIENDDPLMIDEDASAFHPELVDSSNNQHGPKESSGRSNKIDSLLPSPYDSEAVVLVVNSPGSRESITPDEDLNLADECSPADQHTPYSPLRRYRQRKKNCPASDTDSNHDDNSVDPLQVEVVPSDRGTLYVVNNYIFYANRSMSEKGVIYVKCRVETCSSRGSFSSERPFSYYTTHNHPANEADVEVLHMKAELRRLAMIGIGKPREIFNYVSQQFPKASTLIGFKNIRSTLYRYRRLHNYILDDR